MPQPEPLEPAQDKETSPRSVQIQQWQRVFAQIYPSMASLLTSQPPSGQDPGQQRTQEQVIESAPSQPHPKPAQRQPQTAENQPQPMQHQPQPVQQYLSFGAQQRQMQTQYVSYHPNLVSASGISYQNHQAYPVTVSVDPRFYQVYHNQPQQANMPYVPRFDPNAQPTQPPRQLTESIELNRDSGRSSQMPGATGYAVHYPSQAPGPQTARPTTGFASLPSRPDTISGPIFDGRNPFRAHPTAAPGDMYSFLPKDWRGLHSQESRQVAGPSSVPLTSRLPPLPPEPVFDGVGEAWDKARRDFETYKEAMQMRIEAIGFQPAALWRQIDPTAERENVNLADEDPVSKARGSGVISRETPDSVTGSRLLQKAATLQVQNDAMAQSLRLRHSQARQDRTMFVNQIVDAELLVSQMSNTVETVQAKLKESEDRRILLEQALQAACDSRSTSMASADIQLAREAVSSSHQTQYPSSSVTQERITSSVSALNSLPAQAAQAALSAVSTGAETPPVQNAQGVNRRRGKRGSKGAKQT